MKTLQTPNDTDWDRFWDKEKFKSSAHMSWSKRRVIEIIKPRCVAGQSALDAGCGSGFFAKYFCDQKMRVVALDYSQAALEMTKQVTLSEAKLIAADMVNDDLAVLIPQRFDVIFSDGLFEHFPDPDQDRIMRNLISVLNPGGVIITFVPNRWSPWELIRPLFMPGIDEKPFVLSGLKDLNRRNDLAVVQSGGVNVLPFSFSPESLGPQFGMLLYTIAKRV